MRRGSVRCRTVALLVALALACAGCEFVRNEFFFLDVPPPAVAPAPTEPGARAW
jgi:hypothetical protein